MTINWMGMISGAFFRTTVPILAKGAAQKATVRAEAAPPVTISSVPRSSRMAQAAMQTPAKIHVAKAAGRDTVSWRLAVIHNAVVHAKLIAALKVQCGQVRLTKKAKFLGFGPNSAKFYSYY
jgi:hypothetical protein